MKNHICLKCLNFVVAATGCVAGPHGPMTPSGVVVQAARQALGWIGGGTITTSNVYICFLLISRAFSIPVKIKEN